MWSALAVGLVFTGQSVSQANDTIRLGGPSVLSDIQGDTDTELIRYYGGRGYYGGGRGYYGGHSHYGHGHYGYNRGYYGGYNRGYYGGYYGGYGRAYYGGYYGGYGRPYYGYDRITAAIDRIMDTDPIMVVTPNPITPATVPTPITVTMGFPEPAPRF